mgnify:CR=1 FL=1
MHRSIRAPFKRLLKEYALTDDVMDARGVSAIREDMERMEARKLEPHFIQAFFMAAMKRLGGRVASREPGRFEVLEVPSSVRLMSMGGECGHVLASYERICFDKESKEGPGLVPAELVCPGEALLDATVKVLIGQMGSALKRGCVLVDDRDFGDKPRLLLYIENSVQDGTTLADGTKRTVSKEFRFVEVDAAGEARDTGYAPYLDYRGPRPSEASAAHTIASEQEWLTGDIDALAMDFAIREILPVSLKEVRNRRIPQIEKIERAVDARLTDEANYWDGRAWELEEKKARQEDTPELSECSPPRRRSARPQANALGGAAARKDHHSRDSEGAGRRACDSSWHAAPRLTCYHRIQCGRQARGRACRHACRHGYRAGAGIYAAGSKRR